MPDLAQSLFSTGRRFMAPPCLFGHVRHCLALHDPARTCLALPGLALPIHAQCPLSYHFRHCLAVSENCFHDLNSQNKFSLHRQQICLLRSQIILLLRVAEQFHVTPTNFQHLFGRTVFTPSMSVHAGHCFPAPAPVQMPFRLGFGDKKCSFLQSKISQNKSSKFIKIGKWATFLTLRECLILSDLYK